MKLITLGLATLLVTGSVFAADMPTPAVIHDKTGFFVHLDINKVLTSTDTNGACGIVPSRLDYLDHQNREHVLDYQVQGTSCPSDN
ncbi:DUF2790 domain-containing protein [Pseudomonas sp. SDO5271_S396]